MKYFFFFFSFSLFLASCSHDAPGPGTPECIKEKIDAYAADSSLFFIRVYKTAIDNGEHFWFNTKAVQIDGAEFILNEQCDTVCGYCGECVPADCIDDYPGYGSDEWELVWEK